MRELLNYITLLIILLMFLILIPLSMVNMISKFARISFRDAAELGMSYTVLSSLHGNAKIYHNVRMEELKIVPDKNLVIAGFCDKESFLQSVWDKTTVCFLIMLPLAIRAGIKGIAVAGIACVAYGTVATLFDRLFTSDFDLCRGGRQLDKIKFVPSFTIPYIPNKNYEYYISYDDSYMYLIKAPLRPVKIEDGYIKMEGEYTIAIRLKEFEGQDYGSLVYKFEVEKDKEIIKTKIIAWT